ncbi:MAG: lysine--tRNA ligase [Thermoprotei archaeon]|nr:MAG: lysine--tRNA ligase [Thermoprotei archaeon]
MYYLEPRWCKLSSSSEYEERLKKLEEIREQGIDPYPHYLNHMVTPIRELVKWPRVGISVSVAGRILSKRVHGGLAFVDLVDDGWKIQLVFRKNVLGKDQFKWFIKYLDRGDIIEATGTVFYTLRGELSIEVKDYKLLAKSLRPLPGKYGHGIKDPEVRYRKRYLDVMLSPKSRRILEIKFNTIKAIREFLWSKGFIEVETPILQPIYGGAAARPFKTWIWAIDEEWYLRISPELYLKRYIIAGFNKVFEIGKQFRNEDIDVKHNPEFTMIEVYEAYADYNDVMKLTEELIIYVVKKVLGTLKVKFPVSPEEELKKEEERKYHEINFESPWRKMTMKEALKAYADLDVDNLSDREIREMLMEYEIQIPGGYNRGLAIAKLFDKLVEKNLIQPTFILDHPKETTPLCKLHRKNPDLIERFELYIAGMELANAYTELNDPLLQRRFFEEEEARMKKGDEEAHPYDWDFVEALEYGMPPTGGLGLGVDRLVMIMVGTYSIKEVIPFPILKREGK